MDENDETIYTLGAHLGLSPSTMSRYLTGGMSPKLTAIESLSLKFGVDPVWLGGGDVDKYVGGTVGKRIPVIAKLRLNTKVPQLKVEQLPEVGRIVDGVPEYTYDRLDRYEFIPYGDPAKFCYLIADDSMNGARIYEGDTAYIAKGAKVADGDIALVIVDNEPAILRTIFHDNNITVLHANNPSFKDLALYKKDLKRLLIVGRVVAVKFII
jgi:repressor LexA